MRVIVSKIEQHVDGKMWLPSLKFFLIISDCGGNLAARRSVSLVVWRYLQQVFPDRRIEVVMMFCENGLHVPLT